MASTKYGSNVMTDLQKGSSRGLSTFVIRGTVAFPLFLVDLEGDFANKNRRESKSRGRKSILFSSMKKRIIKIDNEEKHTFIFTFTAIIRIFYHERFSRFVMMTLITAVEF